MKSTTTRKLPTRLKRIAVLVAIVTGVPALLSWQWEFFYTADHYRFYVCRMVFYCDSFGGIARAPYASQEYSSIEEYPKYPQYTFRRIEYEGFYNPGPKFEWLPRIVAYQKPGDASLYRGMVVPLWILPFLALTAAVYLHFKQKRVSIGHCSKCHYDLTGNISGVCPECGTEIADTNTQLAEITP